MGRVGGDLSIPDGALLEGRGIGWVLCMRNLLGGYDAGISSFTQDKQAADGLLARANAGYRLGWGHCRDTEARREKR